MAIPAFLPPLLLTSFYLLLSVGFTHMVNLTKLKAWINPLSDGVCNSCLMVGLLVGLQIVRSVGSFLICLLWGVCMGVLAVGLVWFLLLCLGVHASLLPYVLLLLLGFGFSRLVIIARICLYGCGLVVLVCWSSICS